MHCSTSNLIFNYYSQSSGIFGKLKTLVQFRSGVNHSLPKSATGHHVVGWIFLKDVVEIEARERHAQLDVNV